MFGFAQVGIGLNTGDSSIRTRKQKKTRTDKNGHHQNRQDRIKTGKSTDRVHEWEGHEHPHVPHEKGLRLSTLR